MPRPAPSRVAAALNYLERLKNQAAEFGGGVVENLADRARSAGELAYEALATDPNMGRMTTAEYAQAADRLTPRLDEAARQVGALGRAIATQPIETGKAIVQGEVERAREAMSSPKAAGQYAGSFIDPIRIAAALRKTAPVLELDVYHGTPHRFPATEANPLGEFDASKIGTGEGAQAYGHGVYLAEAPEVAEGYKKTISQSMTAGAQRRLQTAGGDLDKAIADTEARAAKYRQGGAKSYAEAAEEDLRGLRQFKETGEWTSGSLYKADLPDEMIGRMLDWDKPLKNQSKAVKQAIASNPQLAQFMEKGNREMTGAEFHNWAQDQVTPPPGDWGFLKTDIELSRLLKEAGIPGIKYKDAGSRGKGGTGTRNFVVFPGEEKKVRILERNGQPAPERIAQALEAAPTVPKKVTQKSLEKQLKAVDPNASLVKTVVFDGQGNRKPMYIARVNNKSVEIGSHLDDVETWAQESLESLANQRKAASINAELGLPETAQTGLWVVQGVDPQGNPFSMERARKAAEKIRFRHEQTNYDDMLQQGISKEEARGDVLAMFNRLKASK